MKIEQLEPFRSKDDSRSAICKIWTDQGKTYATDGRILIEVNEVVEGAVAQDDEKLKSQVLDMVAKIPADGAWQPCPIVKIPTLDCDCLNGLCECSCGHQHECRQCGGSGFDIDTKPSTKIGETLLADHLLGRLAGLPTPVEVLTIDKNSPLYFRFGNGQGRGILMSLRQA